MDASEIRERRSQNLKMRERDFARIVKISEAELVAAYVGHGTTRLVCDVPGLLTGLEAVGEVMALTRNESAVHEKIGVYRNTEVSPHVGIVHGDEIDLRVFPKHWVSAFAVEKADETGAIRRSLQFFDASGDATHKVHLREASNLEAYTELVARFTAPEQTGKLIIVPPTEAAFDGAPASSDELDAAWRKMTDTHQFFGLLRKLNLERLTALEMAKPDLAWPLRADEVATMLHGAVAGEVPIMAFVGSRGCIQIHSGAIKNVQPMGPWINIMDETFHMHLRADQITELWAVRKPTKDGHVTSVEAYAADRSLIIQFFGVRHEGVDERPEWRALVEGLDGRDTPTPLVATA
jgi:putative hemin transport protein